MLAFSFSNAAGSTSFLSSTLRTAKPFATGIGADNVFGANAKTKPDWSPVEKDMLGVIDLEKLLAIERATVENGKR